MSILAKPLSERSQHDNDFIQEQLESIDNIKEVRASITTESLQSLTSYCRLESYSDHQIICRYGEFSSTVYYLLQGSVAITSLNEGHYSRARLQSAILSVVRPGQVFGEIGVINRVPRTASCVAYSPETKIMAIDGRAYNEVLSKPIFLYKQKIINFLSTIPLFQVYDYPKLSGLYESLGPSKTTRSYGACIYNCGEYTSHIFLISKGQVEVCYCPPKERIQNKEAHRIQVVGNHSPLPLSVLVLSEGGFLGEENSLEYAGHYSAGRFQARVISDTCELFWIAREVLESSLLNQQDYWSHVLQTLLKRNTDLVRIVESLKENGCGQSSLQKSADTSVVVLEENKVGLEKSRDAFSRYKRTLEPEQQQRVLRKPKLTMALQLLKKPSYNDEDRPFKFSLQKQPSNNTSRIIPRSLNSSKILKSTQLQPIRKDLFECVRKGLEKQSKYSSKQNSEKSDAEPETSLIEPEFSLKTTLNATSTINQNLPRSSFSLNPINNSVQKELSRNYYLQLAKSPIYAKSLQPKNPIIKTKTKQEDKFQHKLVPCNTPRQEAKNTKTIYKDPISKLQNSLQNTRRSINFQSPFPSLSTKFKSTIITGLSISPRNSQYALDVN